VVPGRKGGPVTDQGWMIHDGTCDQCVRGQCYQCADPMGWDAGDSVIDMICCCDEGYDISSVNLDDLDEP